MEIHEEFYRNGIVEVDFKSPNIDSVLSDILAGKVKNGFSLDSKYAGTLDLRPSVIDYDSIFVDALKENNIPSIVEDATLINLLDN